MHHWIYIIFHVFWCREPDFPASVGGAGGKRHPYCHGRIRSDSCPAADPVCHAVARHDGLTNLLFPFEDIQVDMGKLAMWRLQTHGAFGGTWLSDYVPNRLGGFRSVRQENPRPLCPLLGQDGNIFHLMGIAARVLRQNGMAAEAKEMQTRIMGRACHSYEEALGIISEYVETELSDHREQRRTPRKEVPKKEDTCR